MLSIHVATELGYGRKILRRMEGEAVYKRYSRRTVKSYLGHLRSFFADYPGLKLKQVDTELIRTYIVRRTDEGNYAEATQNQ